jgi:hypothetical protein
MWEHVEKRARLDVQFDQNTSRLALRKELEELKFLALQLTGLSLRLHLQRAAEWWRGSTFPASLDRRSRRWWARQKPMSGRMKQNP